MTSKKVESGLYLSSWDWSNIRFQIMYIRVITNNPKHPSKGEYSSRFLNNMIAEHGVSNSSNRVPCQTFLRETGSKLNIFFLYNSSQ